jgi:hypothetical protein
MGAIGIEIRAGAIFQGSDWVIGRSQLGKPWQGCFAELRRKQADVVPGAQLIINDAVGKDKLAVQLASFYAEHPARQVSVARPTILPAGIVPSLGPGAEGRHN